MALTGQSLVGRGSVRGAAGQFHAVDPRTGATLPGMFGGVDQKTLAHACELAWSACDIYRETTLSARAAFLERIAACIVDLGDELIQRASAETGLPQARIEAERGRTVGQLRFFAEVVRDGGFLDARIDPRMPDRKPMPRVDLRERHIPLGPVAVFGASNFPLAFSVAGGDTASALAAGCPVIVKAHNAHPGTSELVGRAVQRAASECDLPEGVFALLFASGNDVGAALVAHPLIKAVGFTGSRSGGMALMNIAAQRREPIPVYAEMSSINPVYLLPGALEARARSLGTAFAASLTLGAGQMCTNPGLVVAVAGAGLDEFVAGAATVLGSSDSATMLTDSIHGAYEAGVKRLAENPHVQTLACGRPVTGPRQGRPVFFGTDARAFLTERPLHEEVFGAASVLIRCEDFAQLCAVAEEVEGQLTATLQLDTADVPLARRLMPILERKAGRILVNGFPTGVEVSHAMVHGGPFPSTSDGRSTSVGSLAIRRFLRPVCYQDVPAALLPEALLDANPLGLWRRIDGKAGRH